MMNIVCASEEMGEKEKLEMRLQDMELRALMNDMMNKVTQNTMD